MPDFGSFRGFGEKLAQGQTPIQLGLIGSVNFGIEPEAQSYFNRVTSAGGTLTSTEQSAVNNLVFDMKAAGIWTSMKAIYPMVGASAAACAQNLKSASFTGIFNGGWTFASSGVKGNGSSGYFDTAFNCNANFTLNNNSISFYTNTNQAFLANTGPFGAISDTTNYYGYQSYFRSNAGNYFIQHGSVNNQVTNSVTGGMYINTRTAINSFKIFKNNSLFGSNSGNNAMTSEPNVNMWAGCINITNTVNNPSDMNFAFFSLGDGLSDTQSADFYTAVQAFQTTLARQV
jgi:hypothetical protein